MKLFSFQSLVLYTKNCCCASCVAGSENVQFHMPVKSVWKLGAVKDTPLLCKVTLMSDNDVLKTWCKLYQPSWRVCPTGWRRQPSAAAKRLLLSIWATQHLCSLQLCCCSKWSGDGWINERFINKLLSNASCKIVITRRSTAKCSSCVLILLLLILLLLLIIFFIAY